MSEKPILFSGEMVRAILEGRKTQTRRVVKPELVSIWDEPRGAADVAAGYPWVELDGEKYKAVELCPYGRPGDLLWVRETWATTEVWDNVKPSHLPIKGVPVWYCDDDFSEYKKRPSIFMPRWASRITLRVTDVRVERVFDISMGECEAEGVVAEPHNLKPAFAELWDSINAKRGYGWDVNPWVWVVEFEVVK